MKTIFICTHCVLILTLITLTLLLINSALTFADSIDNVQYNEFTNQFKNPISQEEDTNHYSAAISSSATSDSSNLNTFNNNNYQQTEKSLVSEDDQLSNWDNVYDNNFINSNSNTQQTTSSPTNLQEEDNLKKGNKDDSIKSNVPLIKQDQALNKRYMTCTRDFGNITVKVGFSVIGFVLNYLQF